MDAATYAELAAAEQAAAARLDDWRTFVGTYDEVMAERARLSDAYRAADNAREAGFVAFNSIVKQQAIDAATAAHDAHAGEDEAVVLAHMIVAAKDVYAAVGTPADGPNSPAAQLAVRALTMACGTDEEHLTIGMGEP